MEETGVLENISSHTLVLLCFEPGHIFCMRSSIARMTMASFSSSDQKTFSGDLAMGVNSEIGKAIW
jgi:hypothetical protein